LVRHYAAELVNQQDQTLLLLAVSVRFSAEKDIAYLAARMMVKASMIFE
jgi:hypothetical protein